MQPIRFAVAVALAVLVPLGSARGTAIDYQGYAYETGGFPPSVGADTLWIPLIVDNVSSDLGFDLAAEELTGWVSELVSTGTQDLGGGVLRIEYTPARIDIYRDAARDHDFGASPPNATVPASFTNGSACLSGRLTDFVLFLDTATNTGAYQGNVVFDAGECLALLQARRAEGFTFGGVIGRAALGSTAIPAGYDLQVDGYLEATKVPALCPLDCFALTEAELEFPRWSGGHCTSRQNEFEIEGNFTPCEAAALDPAAVEVRLRIGDYVQVFAPGDLRHHHRRHTDSWIYTRSSERHGITKFVLERRRDESWGLAIEGRGLLRTTLLPVDNRLDVELVLGEMIGSVQVVLEQHRKHLSFAGDEQACRPACPPRGLEIALPASTSAGPGPASVQATPNPFNATTTIVLQTATQGQARLVLYDVRGREVRSLYAGFLPAGEHRFTWRGDDATGAAVASGLYVYRVEAPGLSTTGKLVVAK